MNRIEVTHDTQQFGALGTTVFRAAGLIGLVGLAASVGLGFAQGDGLDRFYHAYLVSYAYWLTLSLGALFFVLLQHLTRSGWSVVVRRIAEAFMGTLPLLAVLVLPIIAGSHALYEWTHADVEPGDSLLQWKKPYLNLTFFVARWIAYFVVWVGLSQYLWNRSRTQDRTGDPSLTLSMQWVSAPGMLLYAVTVTFAGIDLLMSLDPHWYSTIYGVYIFAGAVVGVLALLPVVLVLLQRAGRLTGTVTTEHYHDLGKLLFGFVVFWAYIAFSQYMLIWYANMPEETVWYLSRQTGDWTIVSLVLLFGHFVLPFLALVSRYPKRHKGLLAAAAVWLLAMHWVDVYWLAMPQAMPEGRVGLHWLDATCFVGLGGLWVAAAAYRLRAVPLVPQRDPRLPESVAFENT